MSQDIFDSEVIDRCQYPEYRYLMFMLPIVLNARIIVETGLGVGLSTVIFLEACRFLDACKLYTYEININKEDTLKARKRIAELGLTNWWTLIEKDSVEGGKEWNRGKIDILYLDSCHDTQHVYNELKAWEPHVRDGGVIFSHDSFPSIPVPETAKPLEAFKRYAKEKNYRVINLKTPQGMCFLIR